MFDFKETMKRNNTNNTGRLATLSSYELLDTSLEKVYDDITELAASICDTEISLITLIDDSRQFFKSHYGLNFNQTSLDVSFCKHLVMEDMDELIVPNTKRDPRFKENPYVLSDPKISFYAGFSLTAPNGKRLGALCVIDTEPKELDEGQKRSLRTLAQQVVQLFELRRVKKEYAHQETKQKIKEILFNTIVSSTKIGVWEWEKDTGLLKLTKEAATIVGLEHKGHLSVKTEAWEKRIHPSDLAAVKERFYNNAFVNKNKAYDITYRMFHQNGNLLYIQETGKVTGWDTNNEPAALQGTISDITEKTTHNAQIEKLKNNQEALINGTKDLLWSVDTEYNLIIANKAFEQLIKKRLKREIAEGDLALPDEFSTEANQKWKLYYKRALSGEQFSVKEKIQDPSKPLTTYGLISFSPIYDKNKALLGVSCFSKDISSEVLAQQVILSAKEETVKIMNASLDIICTINEDGYFLTINKASERIWGYSPKELIGKKYTDFVYADDVMESKKTEQHVASGQEVSFFENRYVHKNKHLIPMLWSATWDNEEKIMYCVARDITEKRKAEDQLKQSERRFKTLVQEGSEMIAILDENANYIYVSPTSSKVLNIAPEYFIGKNAFDFIHPEHHEAVQAKFKETLNKSQVKIEPFRFINNKGEWLWLETIATDQTNEPSINGIVVNTRDITEKRKAEQRLEQSERRFKTLVQEGTELIAIFDQEANFIYVSPTSNKTLKMAPETLLGTNALDHIHPDDHDAVYTQFAETLETQQVYIKPFRFKNGEGHWLWLETIATNQMKEPSIEGIVVNTRDVTDRVLHLKAIEEQNTALKEIAWNQSHIVRAPVARLMGLINLIKEEGLKNDERAEILDFILNSAEEIDHVIKKNVERTTSTIDIDQQL